MRNPKFFRPLSAIALLGAMLFSFHASANTLNVNVQCDEEGPVYPGTLIMPDNANFTCATTSSYSGVINNKQPDAVLSFNGLTYNISPIDSADIAFANKADCAAAIKSGLAVSSAYSTDAGGSLPAYEAASNLFENAYMSFSSKGALLDGTMGRCSFMPR